MPFHIHGSQMNGFPLPSSSHLSLLLCFPFFSPHLHTVPASFPQLLSRAGHNIGGGSACELDGGVGEEGRRKRCVLYMDVMRGGDSLWHTSARFMFTGVFVCVWACVAVSVPVGLSDMPMGQLLATHHVCCSNGTVTTTVWHLWRINIFHLELRYCPSLVVVKMKKAEEYDDTSSNNYRHYTVCSAVFPLLHSVSKSAGQLFV